MKFSLFTKYGALNSKPVFAALEQSLRRAGHAVVHNDFNADVAVIWSVLWHGRMAHNQLVWNKFRAADKPVMVLEVGGIQRNVTWKVGLNGVNRDAYFGPPGNDESRVKKLGLSLESWKTNKNGAILICTQHPKSHQWQGMPAVSEWLTTTVRTIRQKTDRPIVIRNHPRCNLDFLQSTFKNINYESPRPIPGTYDDFDFSFKDKWAVINWSSNPAAQAVIKGIPVFVGPSSLAHDVGNTNLENIENPVKPDRTQWLNDYAYTEYTVEEIARGIPLTNLTNKLV